MLEMIKSPFNSDWATRLKSLSLNALSRSISGFCAPDLADFYLSHLSPLWSLHQVKARVVDVVAETPDCTSFILQPNALWRGFRAGQHVLLTVEINGVRLQRYYSVSSDPQRQDVIRITVKQDPSGRVSPVLGRYMQRQSIVQLSQAQGVFRLPAPLPERLLLIAGGSGITPLMAMLQQLHADPAAQDTDLVLLYYYRSEQDCIFRRELQALAQAHPRWALHCYQTRSQPSAGQLHGRFRPEHLSQQVPDYAERQTLLCGPTGLMQQVLDHWQAQGLQRRIQYEDFTGRLAFPPTTTASDSQTHQIHFAQSQRSISGSSQQTLLELAEAAGLQPEFGCRMGICRRCLTRKQQGWVQNRRTGEFSREDNEAIQLCLCVPQSDVVLDL